MGNFFEMHFKNTRGSLSEENLVTEAKDWFNTVLIDDF